MLLLPPEVSAHPSMKENKRNRPSAVATVATQRLDAGFLTDIKTLPANLRDLFPRQTLTRVPPSPPAPTTDDEIVGDSKPENT